MQKGGQNKRAGKQKLLNTAILALALVLWLVFGGGNKEPDSSRPTSAAAPQAAVNVSVTFVPAVTQTPTIKTGMGAPQATAEKMATIDENGVYTAKDDVALYIHTYGKLPKNFITKKEANALGWQGGDLRPFKPNACIGGDRFGNYEGRLPAQKGRTYYECDIDTLGRASRGAKRIVFSNDGLIYYTADHYEHFELLYGGKP